VEQCPTHMRELLRSYTDDEKYAFALRFHERTRIFQVVQTILPLRLWQMLRKLYCERWVLQHILLKQANTTGMSGKPCGVRVGRLRATF
jgi:hypothetical protein